MGILVASALALVGAFIAGARFSKTSAPVVGTFTILERDLDYLVAAPHGSFDTHTDEIARGICAATGWSCLVARGFETGGPRINVNRPTEGTRLRETVFSERAQHIYTAYMERVETLMAQPRLYVEIHGNNHPDCQHAIEIATVGVSRARAGRLRKALRHSLRQNGLALTPRIDVYDEVRYAATHNREFGALSRISPALHIELPLMAREEQRPALINALAAALPRMAEAPEEPTELAWLSPPTAH